MQVILKVPATEIDEFNDMLANNIPDEDFDPDGVIKTYTAHFGKHDEQVIEADIKICNGDDGIWIDPVLFADGNEIDVLEPQYVLDGEYPFLDGEFIVKIVKET